MQIFICDIFGISDKLNDKVVVDFRIDFRHDSCDIFTEKRIFLKTYQFFGLGVAVDDFTHF
jgi:hypothetical protein